MRVSIIYKNKHRSATVISELIRGSRDPEIPGSRPVCRSQNPGIWASESRDFRD